MLYTDNTSPCSNVNYRQPGARATIDNRISVEASPGHLPSLDGLRAISILLVIVSHLFERAIIPGNFGVTLFFFISGFLITRLLFVEMQCFGRIDGIAFYVRRFLRLYPVIITYSVAMVVFCLAINKPIILKELLSALFYFSNYLFSHLSQSGSHFEMPVEIFWSLSVEEHFYFAVPLIFVLVAGKPRYMLSIAVAICLFCLAIRIFYVNYLPEVMNFKFIEIRSETRIDSIAFGVLLSVLAQMRFGQNLIVKFGRPLPFFVCCAVILFTLGYRSQILRDTIYFSVQGLCLIPILSLLVFSQNLAFIRSVLNVRIVTWIGKLSYSIYVWHLGVYVLLGPLYTGFPMALHHIALVVTAVTIGACSYYAIERPFIRLGHRLGRHRPKLLTANSKV